ncbi:MAG: hypothetical protein WGN25_01975 [Candidatus Electrothrix sp. GW3-4]|uniref:hypothetical protein n=1 Tax=Candidatus Electrothrix sp. GW3-4 TaxID=3126740 RepID=UPI0030D5491C
MNEYRQAHSVALYDAGVTITNLTVQKREGNEGYPLATGTPPGSFRIPENDLSALKSEFKTKQVKSLPMGRRQGGTLNFHKTLSSYNESLDEDSRVKNLLIRVDGPQLLSIQVVEEQRHAEGKHTETREIAYCGFFAIEWATPEI